MAHSSYYIAQIEQNIGPQGYVILKPGINGQHTDTRIYTRKRYGPGTKRLYGHKFHMSMRDLERKIEKPISEALSTYSYLCRRAGPKKEHFWVKECDVPVFVELVKQLVFALTQQ